MGRTIALVGALHPAARGLALACEEDASVERVLGLSRHEPPLLGPKFEFVPAGPGDERFAPAVAQAEAVVLFPLVDASDRDEEQRRRRVLDGTRLACEAAARAGTLVLWSSGVVYGARAGNPVPLDETAAVQPNLDFPAAGALAETERLVLGLREAAGQAATVLRGAGVWSPTWGTFLARGLAGPAMIGVRGYDPPVQCLAPADAVSALALAAAGRLGGVYNVAPDDWIPASRAAEAAGRRRLDLPRRLAVPTADRLRGAGVAAATVGELAYHMHPWVLANARLRAAGWAPTRSTAEALAEAAAELPEGVRVGRVQVRRSDLWRGAAAGLALLGLAAVARQQGRRSRPG